jgi:valyl-tRNA synthetase
MKPIIYHVHGRNVEIPFEYAHLICMKSRKEIAAEYDIPEWMLKRRVKESNLQLSRKCVLPIEDVVEIYLMLNWPFKMRQMAH